jgi:uncharacterized protein YukE
MLELASTLHSSMNDLITDYNSFVDNVNKTITEFVQNTEQDQETFQVAIRQEFQDFINIVDTKLTGMNNTLTSTIQNLEQIAQRQINNAIRQGKINVIQEYAETAESLNILVTGEV